MLLAVTDLGPRPGHGPAFLSAVLTDGTLFPLAALAIVLPLFLPIAVAITAGEAIAGEARPGTLRYVLVRPVGRTAAAGGQAGQRDGVRGGHGARRRGHGVRRRHRCCWATRASTAVGATSVSGHVAVDPRAGRRARCWRSGYAMLCMLGVAAIALFLSTVADVAARGGARHAGDLRRLHPAADPGRRATRCSAYLPTRYWLAFVDLFRDPILWRDVERGRDPPARLRRGLPRRRLGELRDQGHHRLTPSRGVRAPPVHDLGVPGQRPGAARPSAAATIRSATAVRRQRRRGRPRASGQTTARRSRAHPRASRSRAARRSCRPSVQIATHSGPAGVSSPRVQRAEQVAVGGRAAGTPRAGAAGEVAGQRGQVGAVVGRGRGSPTRRVTAAPPPSSAT